MKSEEDSTKDSVSQSLEPKELQAMIELQLSEVDMLQVITTCGHKICLTLRYSLAVLLFLLHTMLQACG